MSVFDKDIPDLLERHAEQIRTMIKNAKEHKISELHRVELECDKEISRLEGKLEQLEQLKDLKWDYYAKIQLEKR